jgi:V/A-type H+-transporting ATPase subunit B
MPNDDISHPIPDLTGYITEGQIVLERELFQRGIYPPVAGLPSLSRLMKDGIGEGRTRPDHPHVASQLFAAYSKVKEIRSLAAVIGEEELSPIDKLYIKFGQEFEKRIISQGETEDRTIFQSLDIAWEVLKILPRSELLRLSEEELSTYYDQKQSMEKTN